MFLIGHCEAVQRVCCVCVYVFNLVMETIFEAPERDTGISLWNQMGACRHLLFFLTFPPKKQIETPAFCNLNRWRFSIVTKSRLHNQVVGWHLPRPCRRHMKDPSSWVIGHRLAMRRGTKENRVHLWSILSSASLIGMQPSLLPPLSYSILRLTETSNCWMFDWIIRSAMK